MEPISSKEKLPKFLVVNKTPTKRDFNKHLLKPFVEGEIVRVAPLEEQRPHPDVKDMTVASFRKNYVKVIRKDDFGKWSLVYTTEWNFFDLLTTIKK